MSNEATPSDGGLASAMEQLRSILVEGEILEAWAIQRRLFALNHPRILVAATSGRFIALARKLFGGFNMSDFRWQDLTDARLQAGMLGAELTLRVTGTSDLATGAVGPGMLRYPGLVKEQAEKIYRFAQGQEQAWREKRRIRDLEELRARSGGVQIAPSSGITANAGTGAPGDAASRLKQAKEMLDAKLISDSEYESIKARIISEV